MLKLKDVVVIKQEGKETKKIPYDRVYLTHTEGDKTVQREKKSDNVVIATIEEPDPDVPSKADVNTLSTEALNAMREFTVKKEGQSDQSYQAALTLRLLEAAQYGLDLWQRGKIQAKERVGVVDVDKSVERMAAIAVKAGMAANLQEAIEQIKAMQAAKAAKESQAA